MFLPRILLAVALVLPCLLDGQTNASPQPQGIPVTDPLVIAKCGSCHPRDAQGNLQRLSWERATPEAWGDALKRMVRRNRVTLTPREARAIVEYLGTYHGLAPEEAAAVKYLAEHRMMQDEPNVPNDRVRRTCTNCHSFGRALSWRRSPEEWKQLDGLHADLYPNRAQPLQSEEAIAFLIQAAPLHTPEWDAWSAHLRSPRLEGRWLLTAHLPGHGQYYGEMEIQDGSEPGEFSTQAKFQSVQDGSTLVRSGQSLVYAGYAWRGRSRSDSPASAGPDALSGEMHEVLWFAPDQASAEGRWFWGQQQEFGMDVQLRRATDAPTLLGLDRPSLKAGSQGDQIRLFGDHLPIQLTPASLNLGPGITVRSLVSKSANEAVAELDVSAQAPLGKRDISLNGSVLRGGFAIYDRVDYIKITPDSAVVQFGDESLSRSYQQFEAVGYQRGPDGLAHTADDVALGPVDVTWSLDEFSWAPGGSKPSIGVLTSSGLYEPAVNGPRNNYDVWVVATAKSEKDQGGQPLMDKSYLVVSVPEYTLNGRHYVRELGRWVEDGAGGH
ncbi:MAG TPA: quinohemoprotein amine dehydrogenase subunit alpha [Bryobacteraceae bacterium]|nr:quinohemoprotein amine dehydrogenase subunit alpha [Bryobacteraceae bacterium]